MHEAFGEIRYITRKTPIKRQNIMAEAEEFFSKAEHLPEITGIRLADRNSCLIVHFQNKC